MVEVVLRVDTLGRRVDQRQSPSEGIFTPAEQFETRNAGVRMLSLVAEGLGSRCDVGSNLGKQPVGGCRLRPFNLGYLKGCFHRG